MNKKDYNFAKKKLDELFERDMEEVGLQISMKFVQDNKRNPSDKEMLEIVKRAEKIVGNIWKAMSKNPKDNFKWIKKNSN